MKATSNRKSFFVIIAFWITLPTLDMFSDMRLIHKFFSGPAPDTVFYGKGGNVDDEVNNSTNLVPFSILSLP